MLPPSLFKRKNLAFGRLTLVLMCTLLAPGQVLSQEQNSAPEIIDINPDQIQTIVAPPWEQAPTAEFNAWQEKIRNQGKVDHSDDLLKAAVASSYRGFKALREYDFVEASKAHSEAATLDPLSPYPYLGFAEIYRMMMQPDKARYCAEEAAKRSRGEKTASLMLGVEYAQGGDYKKAEKWLKNALKLDPQYKGAHLMLSKTYHLAGDKELAALHQKLAQCSNDKCL